MSLITTDVAIHEVEEIARAERGSVLIQCDEMPEERETEQGEVITEEERTREGTQEGIQEDIPGNIITVTEEEEEAEIAQLDINDEAQQSAIDAAADQSALQCIRS